MRVDFTNPSGLLLLALALLAINLSRKSLANVSTPRAVTSVVVRTLLLLLLILAISGLRIRTASRDLAIIFLVDVSASIAPENRRETIDFINVETHRARPRDFVGIVAFAREPVVELTPTRKDALGDWRLTEIASNPPRDYTDVAAALRLASALVPDEATGRFVLISDGNENLESAAQETDLLRASGIEVHTRAINITNQQSNSRGEVAVRTLEVPAKLAEAEAFELKVTIDATVDSDATLRIFRNDSLAAERSVHLVGSGENVFSLSQRAEQKGFYTYRAEVEAIRSDTFTQNNVREAFAVVEGRPKTLYLFGDARPSPAILRVLSEGQFAADIRGAFAAPTALSGFQDYDLVIFDNVPASSLTAEQMKMVRSYVRDLGGGFIMVGGDQSFGPGGYYKTPIEDLLPVSLDVRQKKHLPSLALALVIDKSGSMAGTKMDLTKEAASAAVDFLSERDSVGVIAFDSAAIPVVTLTKCDDKPAIIRQIETIQALGGTNMYPGLRTAGDWLRETDAQIKHIIVLSDGRSEDGAFRGIARQSREAGITLTAVAVGDDADLPMMKMIADIGGGRFYQTNRPDNLPRIFTREASLASRTTIIEEPFVTRLVRPTQASAGIDWSASPQLGGYVATAERDSLKSPAVTSLVSDKDDPVYAVWQYGLGRAAAFTSDAKARWAANWMNWPGFGQFWTQVLRDTLRHESSGKLTPRVEIIAGRGHVSVEAATPDGDFMNNLRLRAHIVAPDFSTSDIALDQTAAGLYEADFAAISRGNYLVSVIEEGGQSASITGAVNSYSPEFNITSVDADSLGRISEATGGSAIPVSWSDVDLFERRAGKTIPHEIWEMLLLGALLLLPVDIGLRRVHITREQFGNASKRLRSRLSRRASVETDSPSAASLDQLKEARTRVRLGSLERIPSSEEGQLAKPAVSSAGQNGEEAVSDRGDDRSLGSRLLEARRRSGK